MKMTKEKAVKKEQNKEKTSTKKESKDTKIQELTNDLKRIQADFSNYCKRMDKDKKEFIEYASAAFICKLLPILDELKIALRKIKNENDKKGIQMIFDNIKKLLSEQGVKEIKCIGQKFDPYKHEAMLFEDSDEDGKILEELQKGYMIKNKVLRYAKVKVSKASDNEKEPAENKQDSKQLEGESK